MIYRIKDWDEHFENNRSKELKKISWVPVPNTMDGEGYACLVDHPNGAAHLGAWLAIIQIGSRCQDRGTLIRDGKPLTPRSLAMISRLPVSVFVEVLPRLMSPEIGWMEDALIADEENAENLRKKNTADSAGGAGNTGLAAGNLLDPAPRCGKSAKSSSVHKENARAEQNRIEGNRTELETVVSTEHSASDDADGFTLQPPPESKRSPAETVKLWFEKEFWPLYPRKVDRAEALKACLQKLPGSGVGALAILKGLREQLPKFQALIAAGEPDRVPHASTWIRKRRWEDSVEPVMIRGPSSAAVPDRIARRNENNQLTKWMGD